MTVHVRRDFEKNGQIQTWLDRPEFNIAHRECGHTGDTIDPREVDLMPEAIVVRSPVAAAHAAIIA